LRRCRKTRQLHCGVQSPKRIDDPEPAIKLNPILQVFGPESVAIGARRRGGDHGIVDRQSVALCERQSRLPAIGLVPVELEVGRKAPAKSSKAFQQLLTSGLTRHAEFTLVGNMDFDLVALFQLERVDYGGGKAGRRVYTREIYTCEM